MNVCRDGRVHVVSEMCSTCIFRPGNLMHLNEGRVKGMVRNAIKKDSCIVCHSTLDTDEQACCKGFWDRHKNDSLPLRAADMFGMVAIDKSKK